MDGFLTQWCTVEGMLKALEAVSRGADGLSERAVAYLKGTVYRETTEKSVNSFVQSLHEHYDKKVDNMRLVGSSLSFGLLLACIGLILTIVYLLMH